MPALVPTLKNRLRRSIFYSMYNRYRQDRLYDQWLAAGRPAPPPHGVKQRAIRELATRFGIRTFIETGTYRGDMVDAMARVFERVYSVELSRELHADAVRRFAGRPSITLLQGDSGKVLGELLPTITQPALLWLDGHYSAGVTARADLDSPVREELEHVARHPLKLRHVVLIDDARCFTGEGGYPTLDELRAWAAAEGFSHFEVTDDVIHVYHDAGR